MTTLRRPVQVGVIGAGAMGSLHARVVTESARARLGCVIDPDRKAGKALADRHGARWRGDLDGITALDALIVASSTESHRYWAEAAIAAGKPVLVEKPLSTNLEDCRSILDSAAAAGVPTMCGFVERFNPAVLVAAGIVEAPHHLRAVRHGPYAGRIRCGVAYDLSIHDADLAVRFFGEGPGSVRAQVEHIRTESAAGAEDVAEMHLAFPSGGTATLSASRVASRRIRTIAVNEPDRRVEVDLIRQEVKVIRQVRGGPRAVVRRGTEAAVDIPVIPGRRDALASQLDHFLALIHGDVDCQAERRGALAAHEVVASALSRALPTTSALAPA